MSKKKYNILGFPILEVEKNNGSIKAHIFRNFFPQKTKNKSFTKTISVSEDSESSVLKIGLQEGGGIGDSLFQLIYLKELRKNIKCKLRLDFFSRAVSAFRDIPFIDHVFPYIPDNPNRKKYDIWITSRRLWSITINNRNKVLKLAPDFLEFCEKNQNRIKEIFGNEFNDNKVSQYALLLNKNRFEQANLFNLLPIDRNTIKYMNWNTDAFDILSKYNLKPKSYITICRAVDAKYNSNHPKLWPLKYYNQLISDLKKKYPNILIVQIGSNESFGNFDNTDINLVGKTSLDEVKVILKYSLLHIDGEGGLIHMNKCLGGKSLVLFGPTLPAIYGYEENINIHRPICPVSCCQVVDSWKEGCIRYKEALCMSQIKPNLVLKKIIEYISKQPAFNYFPRGISRKDVLSHLRTKKNIALYSRPSEEELTELKKSKCFTIFDATLSNKDDKDCSYLKDIQKIGGNAEYAFPYNIPVNNETYDLVFFPNLPEKHPNYAIYEGLRILQKGGTLIIKNKINIQSIFQNCSNISDAFEYIGIRKEI